MDEALLKKFIGMMGSEHDGERAVAAKKFMEHLKAAGVHPTELKLGTKSDRSFSAASDRYDEMKADRERREKERRIEQDELAVCKHRQSIMETFLSQRVIDIVDHQTGKYREEVDRARRAGQPSYYYKTKGRPGWQK